jgi:hypothetical protein
MASSKQVLDRNVAAVNGRDLDAYLDNQQPDIELILPSGVTLRGRVQVGQYALAPAPADAG